MSSIGKRNDLQFATIFSGSFAGGLRPRQQRLPSGGNRFRETQPFPEMSSERGMRTRTIESADVMLFVTLGIVVVWFPGNCTEEIV
jgi:hypothetical protein